MTGTATHIPLVFGTKGDHTVQHILVIFLQVEGFQIFPEGLSWAKSWAFGIGTGGKDTFGTFLQLFFKIRLVNARKRSKKR